jgi:hypothetical protein
MSPIWINTNGDIRMAASGVPELVRAWTYQCCWTSCRPDFVIIGCNPPECVNFKDENADNIWIPYARATCGAWSGSGGYAWPDDVPDCPYPDGIHIESVACPDPKFTELKVEITGTLTSFFVTVCDDINYHVVLNANLTGYDRTGCWNNVDDYRLAIQFDCGGGDGATGCPAGFDLQGRGGWGGSVDGEEYYRGRIGYSVSISCTGAISFVSIPVAGAYGKDIYWAGDGSIPLNAQLLPIGSTAVDVYGYYGWTNKGLAGTLALTVSEK